MRNLIVDHEGKSNYLFSIDGVLYLRTYDHVDRFVGSTIEEIIADDEPEWQETVIRLDTVNKIVSKDGNTELYITAPQGWIIHVCYLPMSKLLELLLSVSDDQK